jgi:hypothetical protein
MDGGERDDLEGFFRATQAEGGWLFEVAVVQWHGPHSPELRWHVFRRWKRPPDAARLARARAAALSTPRFFRLCTTCNTRRNAGHMHDRDLCQKCAAEHHGIVY